MTDVQAALGEVRKVMEDVVRREQHRNDLTNLPNERALDDRLEQAFTANSEIWCAFVEIDNFKRINTIYKYQAGNAVLKKVAELLDVAAGSYFGQVGPVEAFHAHGDEFYLIGTTRKGTTAEHVEQGLNAVRASIGATSLPVSGFDTPMSVTVTVGWAFKSDLEGDDATRLGFRKCVEDAVGFGKRAGRNRVARYDGSMQQGEMYSDRGNCMKCEAAFTFEVEQSKLSEEPLLYCPNCGTTQKRPSRPSGAITGHDA